jgi:hypothetical protein
MKQTFWWTNTSLLISERTTRIRRESSEIRWNLKTVFRTENCWDFFDVLWPNSCSFPWKTTESRWKNPTIVRSRILLPIFIDYRGFPAENSDFALSSVSIPVIFGAQNHRPEFTSITNTRLYFHVPPFDPDKSCKIIFLSFVYFKPIPNWIVLFLAIKVYN